jgi:hypothetical protein
MSDVVKIRIEPFVDFTPCRDECPAVTGKAFGSVKFCSMQQKIRHKKNRDSECCFNFQCCFK